MGCNQGRKPYYQQGGGKQEDMGYREQEVLYQHVNNKNQRVPQGGVTQIPQKKQ